MRWKAPNKHDTRTKTRFLIFPKKLGNEWRWLEVASWVEEYSAGFWWGERWVEE